MRSTAARTTARVVGVIAIVVGAVWVGQGLGYLPGSFMTGVKFWFWVGRRACSPAWPCCSLPGAGLPARALDTAVTTRA